MLVRCYFLRGGAFLVEYIIKPHADGDGVSNVRDQVWASDAEGERGVVNVVDKVVHLGSFEIHKAVDMGLGG